MLEAEQGVVSSPSLKQSMCDAVLQLVLEHVRADGYGPHILDLVRRHFATLPSRYALSVDPHRHDDVLLHMRLLNEVRDQATPSYQPQTQLYSDPCFCSHTHTHTQLYSHPDPQLSTPPQTQFCSPGPPLSSSVEPRPCRGPIAVPRGLDEAGPVVSVRRVGLGAAEPCCIDIPGGDPDWHAESTGTATGTARHVAECVTAGEGGGLAPGRQDDTEACCALPDLRIPKPPAPAHTAGVPRGPKRGGGGGRKLADPYAHFRSSADEFGKRAWGGGGADRTQMYHIPRPTFGSCANLASLHITSPPSKASRSSRKRSPRGIPVPSGKGKGKGTGLGMDTRGGGHGSRGTPRGTPTGTPSGGILVLGSGDRYTMGFSPHCRSAPISGQSVLGGRKGSMSSLDEEEGGGEEAYGEEEGSSCSDQSTHSHSHSHSHSQPHSKSRSQSQAHVHSYECGQRDGGSPGWTLLGGRQGGAEGGASFESGDRGSTYGERGERESSCGDGWSECEWGVALGWEVTIAAPDRPGLLTSFTSAIGQCEHDLDIKEAHVFSSSDGYALQVFVVTSPNPHEETLEIQESLQRLLKATWQDKASMRSTETHQINNLKASVESMCYEDWAVEAKELRTHEKLGGGSSGRLYRGTYRGQEVAVKVICLAVPEAYRGDTGALYPDPLELEPTAHQPMAHRPKDLGSAPQHPISRDNTGAHPGDARVLYPDLVEQRDSAHLDARTQYREGTAPSMGHPGAQEPCAAEQGAEGRGTAEGRATAEGPGAGERGASGEQHLVVISWDAAGDVSRSSADDVGGTAGGGRESVVGEAMRAGVLDPSAGVPLGMPEGERRGASSDSSAPVPRTGLLDGLGDAMKTGVVDPSAGVRGVSRPSYVGCALSPTDRDRLAASSLSQADTDRLAASLSPPPAQLASATELLQCFQREVSIMRAVRHKNVLQFIGACSCWPRLYIVTELMSRGSIREVLDQLGTGLPLHAALRVFRDAARGMDFLHRRGIVHRDLKAANLLIDENDVVKVCDFGVARFVPCCEGEDTGLGVGVGRGTGTGSGGSQGRTELAPSPDQSMDMTSETGTYRWMAPEVLEHKPYGFKADVFSFGITMWEVLTGDIPYKGMTPLQAAVGVVQRGLRPALAPGTPPLVAGLLMRCWEPEPAQRPTFSEVLAMLAHLEETVQGEGSRGRERGRDREPLLDRQHSGGFHQLWKKTFGKK